MKESEDDALRIPPQDDLDPVVLDTSLDGVDNVYEWAMVKREVPHDFEKGSEKELIATLPKRLRVLKKWNLWRLFFSVIMLVAAIWFVQQGFEMIHPDNMKDEYDATYILALVSGAVLGLFLGQILQEVLNSLLGTVWFKGNYKNYLLLLKYYHRCVEFEEEQEEREKNKKRKGCDG